MMNCIKEKKSIFLCWVSPLLYLPVKVSTSKIYWEVWSLYVEYISQRMVIKSRKIWWFCGRRLYSVSWLLSLLHWILPIRRRCVFHELFRYFLRAPDWLILMLQSRGSSSGLKLYIGLKPERPSFPLVSTTNLFIYILLPYTSIYS